MKKNDKLYWSPFNMYEECPQQFLWSKGWEDLDVGGGPGRPKPKPERKSRHDAIMGISIQSAIETMYNDELWRYPSELKTRLEKLVKVSLTTEIASSYIDWRRSPSQAELEQICLDGVRGYLKTMKHHKLLGPYARAEVNLGGYLDQYTPIGGIADVLIRREDMGISIIDGKNSKTKMKYVKPDQLRWYALCFYLGYNRALPNRLGFVWYRYPYDEASGETGIDWVDFTKRDLQDLAQRIMDAKKGMYFQKFEARPSSKACHFCDYESVCPQRQAQKQENRLKKGLGASLPVIEDAGGALVEFGIESTHAGKKVGNS